LTITCLCQELEPEIIVTEKPDTEEAQRTAQLRLKGKKNKTPRIKPGLARTRIREVSPNKPRRAWFLGRSPKKPLVKVGIGQEAWETFGLKELPGKKN